MKRKYALPTTIIILIGFLIVAFFNEQSAQQAKAKQPTVGILQLMSHPALDAIHKGVIAGLKSEGFQVGKNLKIDFQNAQNDQSNLKTMSNKFADENVDLAIGITTPAAQSLANTIDDKPVILGAVTDPQNAGLVKNNQKPGGNITGVSDQPPLEQQIKLIQKLMPNLKTIGFLYTSSDDSSASQYPKFKQAAKKLHVKIKPYSISNTNDLNQVAEQMVREVQAIYVPTDNTIAGAMQTLVGAANHANVPIFPSADTMVKDGGVATYGIDQFQLGVATGKMSAAILKGDKLPKTTPIDYVKNGKLIINLKQAKRLHITIPKDLMQEATKKGELIKWV